MSFSPSVRSDRDNRAHHSLPAYLTPFIGRDALLDEVRAELLRPETRMMTLVGPGGVGKTRIAVQAASRMTHKFEDVFFVDFTPLTDVALALPLLAQAMGVIEDGPSPLATRLAGVIGQRRFLLVLDNLERILDVGPELTSLLRACPRATILATSRAPLRVSGEQEFPVPPLELPDAISLFVSRARAVRSSISSMPENDSTIAAVCRELDGLPLAIELAAARTKVLSPEAILTRLEFRLNLLTGGPLDAPGRQRTLRDAIAWSYDLLAETDRRRFRGLAVFAGGFTLDAYERIVEDEHSSTADALDTISALVDQNLVRILDRPGGNLATQRFALLETVREFAIEQLIANHEQEAIAGRHAAYSFQFIERAAPEMAGPDAAEWMSRIENELPDLRAALGWLIERQLPDEAVRLASAPWLFWMLCGRLGEGRSWLDRALAVPGGSPILRARAVGVTGILASNQGDYAYESRIEQEGLIPARELGDQLGEAIALFALGDMAGDQNDFDRATDVLQAAAALSDRLGDSTRATMALFDLGSISRRSGHEERGEALMVDAVIRARSQGFGLATAFGLNLLSRIARARGNTEQARAMYRESLELAWQLRHRLSIAFILLDGAALAAERAEPERAARLLGAAEALREAIGLPREPSAGHATGAGYESTLSQVEAALGAQRFAAAWIDGRSMSLDQAVEEAMWEATPDTPGGSDSARSPFGLTSRELDVLRLLVDGLSDRQIGDTLFISPRTAQVHVANILAKLNVPTRGAAAAAALRLGVVDDSPPSQIDRPLPGVDPLRT